MARVSKLLLLASLALSTASASLRGDDTGGGRVLDASDASVVAGVPPTATRVLVITQNLGRAACAPHRSVAPTAHVPGSQFDALLARYKNRGGAAAACTHDVIVINTQEVGAMYIPH